MLSLDQIKSKIAEYASARISLGDFEDWFYENSIDPIPGQDVESLVSSIDEALSKRHFGKVDQDVLRVELRELANAARPFRSIVRVNWHEARGFEVPVRSDTAASGNEPRRSRSAASASSFRPLLRVHAA